MTKKLKAHPVADLFPMLPDDELKDLAHDIAERGLLQAIVLDGEGRILDGRNRYAACELASVEPKFETYDGDDADGFALAVNLARRHLTTGARAVIAAKAARLNGYGSATKIAAFTDLQNSRISEAAMVLDWCDAATVNKVIGGDMPLTKAVEQARGLKKADAQRKAKRERLSEQAADLLARVDDAELDLDEAIGALDVREEKAREEEAQRRSEEERKQLEHQDEVRTAKQNLGSVLIYLTSETLAPGKLAETYAEAAADIDPGNLHFAARTMTAIANRRSR